MASSSTAIPKEWPPPVVEQYLPIRVLGKGGFASVVLAKNKSTNEFRAIKVVAGDDGYAHREIDIVHQLSHDCIMKIYDYWEVSDRVVICLSYSKGPTVEMLLQHGGALSNTFGRVVVAQTTDAVAYLHSHAVVHRDIKPDNIIVTGASSADRSVWENNAEDTNREPPWKTLLKKWHVTLIDFGFARALTPQDVVKPSIELKKENLRSSFHHLDSSTARSMNKSLSKRSSSKNLDTSSKSSNSKSSVGRSRASLNRSISHRFHRTMSSLGNRNFAAPEILKVQHNTSEYVPARSHPLLITDTLSEYTAEYGLLVDAYSLGYTIQYMMTGISPNQDDPTNKPWAIQLLEKLMCKKKKETRIIRQSQDLPGEVQRLIEKLTEPSESNRTSVRAAREYYPWINDVMPEMLEKPNNNNEIQYLTLTLKQKEREGSPPNQTGEKDTQKMPQQGVLEESAQPVGE